MIREVSLLPLFISLRASAKWVNGFLLMTMAVAWVAMGIHLANLRLLVQASRGTAVEPIQRAAQLATHEWLVACQATLLMASAITFLLWIYQARLNVRALGVRRPAFGSEWAFLSFVIPLLNLFRPYQVVREIWQASDPSTLDPFNWKSVRSSRLLPLWWGLYLGSIGCASLAGLTSLGAGVSLAKLELTTAILVLTNLFAGLGAGASYLLIQRISAAQEEKFARLLASENEKPE